MLNETRNSSSSSHLDVFYVFVAPIIYGLACIATASLLILLLSQRKHTKLPPTVNAALCSLLTADLISLIVWIVFDLYDKLSQETIFHSNRIVCYSLVYILVTCSNLQGYIQCLISLERLLAVLVPLKVRRLVTILRMAGALVGVFLFVGLLHVFYVGYGYSYQSGRCQVHSWQRRMAMGIFDAVVYCGVPSVIQFSCTFAIIFLLIKRHRSSASNNDRRLTPNEIRLSAILIVMNLLYVLTTLPLTLLFFLLPSHVSFQHRELWNHRSNLAWLLTMVGASTDWIVLLCLGRQMRRAAVRMVCGHRRGETSQSTSGLVYSTVVRQR